LNDPIDFGNIESTSGDVGAEEDSGRGVTEFEESVGSLLLLLFTLSTIDSGITISSRVLETSEGRGEKSGRT